MKNADFGLLAFSWALYFLVHSWLAADRWKNWLFQRCPGCRPCYRLCYNGVAVITLLPPLWLMRHDTGPLLWAWQGPFWWLSQFCALAAIGGFLWSLRYYDGRAFLGFSQQPDSDALVISPLHRWVRHPWYTLALIFLWSRDMHAATLLTSACMTLYFILGSRMEEQKLLHRFGDQYADYRRQVPGIIPNPWRHLTHS